MALTPAEQLLQSLGVTDPAEIDLAAIAYHVGARVRRRPLDGCEARIIGYGDNAIITVNVRSSLRRQRFSIAHELGHWHHHRGQSLVCRGDETRPQQATAREQAADTYAADLLMPRYIFRPRALRHGSLSFDVVSALAEDFNTSQTATAIRLITIDHTMALLVCHGKQGRKWFNRTPTAPDDWFLKQNLDVASSAFEILFGNRPPDRQPRRIRADAWFNGQGTQRHELLEQTIRIGDEILTLLFFTNVRI